MFSFSVVVKLDIDNALETLTNSIVEARSIAIPKCEVKFESVILDDDLKLLIRLKNVRRRQLQSTRDPAIKVIWLDWKEIKKSISQLRNKNFENKISQLDPDSEPFWKLSKIMKNPQKPIIALKEENKLLLTNCEKARKLDKLFAHNFNLGLTSPIENQVTQDFKNILIQEIVSENLEEVRIIIKKIKKYMKAPGDDGFTYILI